METPVLLETHHTIALAGGHLSVLGKEHVMSPSGPMLCVENAAEVGNWAVFQHEVVL